MKTGDEKMYVKQRKLERKEKLRISKLSCCSNNTKKIMFQQWRKKERWREKGGEKSETLPDLS